MPSPPNDSKRRQAACSSKRKGQAKDSHCANIVTFPVADTMQAAAGTAPYLPEIQQAIDTTLSFTPLQLLAVIIKTLLRERIKDDEVHRICKVYYEALESIWGDEEE